MEPPYTFIDYVPFIGLATGRSMERTSPLMTRLLETVVMSLIAGAAGMYVSTKVMEADIANMKANEQAVQAQLVHQMDDLRSDIRELRAEMAARRH